MIGPFCKHNQITVVQERVTSFFRGILLFICNFLIHIGGRASYFRMSVIALPESAMSKFTAVSIMWNEFVVLYGEFLGNHCLT